MNNHTFLLEKENRVQKKKWKKRLKIFLIGFLGGIIGTWWFYR